MLFSIPRFHNTTGCQSGLTTLLHEQPLFVQPGWMNSHCSFNTFSNRFDNRFDNRLDNRLYRVNGDLSSCSGVFLGLPLPKLAGPAYWVLCSIWPPTQLITCCSVNYDVIRWQRHFVSCFVLMLRSIHVVKSCSRDHVILVITSSRLANGTHF